MAGRKRRVWLAGASRVLLHLLGPNNRPVQITDDLRELLDDHLSPGEKGPPRAAIPNTPGQKIHSALRRPPDPARNDGPCANVFPGLRRGRDNVPPCQSCARPEWRRVNYLGGPTSGSRGELGIAYVVAHSISRKYHLFCLGFRCTRDLQVQEAGHGERNPRRLRDGVSKSTAVR